MIPGRLLNSLFLFNSRCNSSVNTIRLYSSFPKHYVKPVYKVEEQALLESRMEDLAHIPVKPAFSHQTCSEFHDETVRKFTHYIMRTGDKVMARKLLNDTFENIKIKQLEKYYNASPEERNDIILDPKEIFHRAVQNCIPILELRDLRRGGITYRVPVPLNPNRGQFFAMTWLIESAKDRGSGNKFADLLANELLAAANNEGKVMKRKHDLHKHCEANRAYAHYRWLE